MSASATSNQHYNQLTAEEQDLLFYAIHDAREAAQVRWWMEFDKPMPASVERAVAEQYAAQLGWESEEAAA